MDKVRDYKDPTLKDFITSDDLDTDNEKMDLINIYVAQKAKEHPHFKNVEMDINVKLGNIIVNFKPDTLLKVLDFVKVSDDEVENAAELAALEASLQSQQIPDDKSDITDLT